MLGFPLLLASNLPELPTSKPRGKPAGTAAWVTAPNNPLWSISFSLSTGIGLVDFWQQAWARPLHQVCHNTLEMYMKASRKGRHFCLVPYTKTNCVASCIRTESGLRESYPGLDYLGKEQILHKTQLTKVKLWSKDQHETAVPVLPFITVYA